jgi:3-phosphoshikimate 1-carboxyvinyltransferase
VLADARQMPAWVRIPPLKEPFDVTIEVPGSKSLTNRVLLLAALSSGQCDVRRPLLDAQDAQVMIAAIRQLGARVEQTPGGDLVVWGTGPRWKPAQRDTVLNLANAGTATRFLAAAGLLAPPGHTVTIDGSPRMRERPIGELVKMLRDLGGTVDELGKPGFPPIRVHGLPQDAQPEPIRVGRTASSQFISAVLMLGPFVPFGVALTFDQPPTSEPYVRMTMDVLDRVGAAALWRGHESGSRTAQVQTTEGELGGFRITIEPDASSAGYWWTAATMIPGARAVVPGPGGWDRSLQGDVKIQDVLAKMAGERVRAVDADLADIPDAAMALAAACAVADGPSTLRGLRTLRVKETDRVEALRAELTRLGCGVRIIEDADDVALHITPLDPRRDTADVEVHTYDDHRMAMGLALIGLKRPGVIIDDPACVAKTYATFWSDLRRLYP